MQKRLDLIKKHLHAEGRRHELAMQNPLVVSLPNKYIFDYGSGVKQPDFSQNIVLQLHSNGTVTWDVA